MQSDLQPERYDHFPEILLDLPACELWRQLRGPAFFSIAGRRPDPLFVSVLLHGNEDSGWQAIQSVLRRHRGALLPRPLLLFVGNVAAARERLRSLPGQEDYNRAWPGTDQPETPTARLLRAVFELVGARAPFASIDIHNNSGRNPHYACVSRLDERHLHLARLFSRTVVYFERPVGVQSAALAQLCPAVVAECGRAGEPAGIEHAAQLIESGVSFGVLGNGHGNDAGPRLEVMPTHDLAPRDAYFSYDAGVIGLARPAVPAMLTLDQRAVRLDCLGYLMQRIGRDGRPTDRSGDAP
jgi:hypothetical protein